MYKNISMVAAGLLAGVCLVFTYNSTASAASGSVSNQIKSKGKIAVENGEESLLIDSADFYTLAGEIDEDSAQLERLRGIVGAVGAAPEDPAVATLGRLYMQGDCIVRCVESGGALTYQMLGSASDALTYLEQEISELKKSVSDGKNSVAATVTELGIDAATDGESFGSLATKIGQVAELWYEKGRIDNFRGSAMPSQVKRGKTFVNASGNQTGTMSENGPSNAKILSEGSVATLPGYVKSGSYTVREGYTTGGVVTVADLASQTQVASTSAATPNQILEGYGGYVNGKYVEGKLKATEGSYTYPQGWSPANGFTYTSSGGLYSSYSVNAYWVWKKGYDEQYAASYNDGYNSGVATARNGG